MNKKKAFAFFFLPLFFAFFFRIGFRTPVVQYIYIVEAALLVLLFIFFFFFILGRMTKGLRFNSMEILIFVLMLLPLVSAYSAQKTFGQPLIYGILAQRDIYLAMSGLVLLSMLRRRIIDIESVEKAFVTLSWACLIIFSLLTVLVNPERYTATEMVSYSEAKGGYIFLFNVVFVLFGTIYYAINSFITKRPLNIICALAFFLYLFFVRQDRTIVLSAAFSIIVFFASNLSVKSLIRYSFYFFISALIALATMKAFKPELIERNIEVFSNAFETIGGKVTKESSTSIRLYETAVAAEHILKKPYLGNGDMSNRWRGGFESKFGYFYPSDIGVLGVVFIYGVVGTLISFVQFPVAYYYIKKVSNIQKNRFFLTCKYFLLSFFLDSLTAGHMVFFAASSTIIIVIIFYYFSCDKSIKRQDTGVVGLQQT